VSTRSIKSVNPLPITVQQTYTFIIVDVKDTDCQGTERATNMILRAFVTTIIFICLSLGATAQADRWNDESGNGNGHGHGHGRGHGKSKHYQNNQQYQEVEYEVEDTHGGPPPWAPAHGYRRNHKYDESTRVNVRVRDEPQYREQPPSPEMEFEVASEQIGITAGTCNRENIGAVLGGIAGGIIGNKASSEKDKTVGTLAGALIGVVLGKELGRRMDKADVQCTGQALERARDGQTVGWANPDSGQHYSVTPTRTYKQADGRYCRAYNATVNEGSRENKYKETACRNDSGTWERLH